MNALYQPSPGKLKSIVTSATIFFLLPFLLYAIYNTTILISRATGKPADITVNATLISGTIDNKFYKAFAQGGEESTDMLRPVINQVKSLNPELIRLDHIYDHYNVVSGEPGAVKFDFSRLDQAVETVISTGATPLLSLSYMPSVIAQGGVIINPPVLWDDWAGVVKATIEHYSGKSGKNLTGVYYEVWNEPDLGQFGSWKLTGDKNYLTLYSYAAKGAKSAQNTNRFHLGGPSTTGLYKNWIVALAKSGQRVDYFSWHTYNPNPNRLAKDMNSIYGWLKTQPLMAIKPKLITEFGFTGDKDTRYQTTFAAAYTIATIRQLMDVPPQYLFSFQLKDGPNQESGAGWGLLSHETAGATTKPRFYVYNFLSQIQGKRLGVKGEGSWVTGYAAIDNSTIQLMLVNFSQNGGARIEQVPVKFINLPGSQYQLKLDYLFETSCALDQPKDTALPQIITPNSGITNQTVCLPENNAVIIRLAPVP
jgi:hypothetical protein